MSLILVVARERASDEPELSADAWLGWLAGNVELGQDGLSIDYTDGPAGALAAANLAIRDGRRQVAIIPVAEDSSASSPAELSDLSTQVAQFASRHTDASVLLVGAPPSRTPTFSEILSELHPPDSEDPQLLTAAIERAFDGDTARFGDFVKALQRGVPRGTQLALRGSAIQGYAYGTEEPFDAKGPGTSDLDVVVFGEEAMAAWHDDGFVVRGVNTLPLSDETAWFAPSLDRARREAQAIARRPVSIQAMAPWFLDLRAALQVQPYVLLVA
ncbi:MAG: hypothetical protein EHM90_03010 [Chloroflexi bacterium]|nr:MAG: hypothetical protein EHM90_03010 [Chloroflexota bacterium]